MVLMLSISEFIAAVCFGLGFVTDPEICTYVRRSWVELVIFSVSLVYL